MDIPRERLEKVILFAFGITDELQREGRLTGGSSVSDDMKAKYRALVEEGFVPDTEELFAVLAKLLDDGHIYHAQVVEP